MCCTCEQTTQSLSSLPHPLCVVPVNRPHIACHPSHIIYVVPVNISITSSMCCTCQQTTHSLSSLPRPLCVVPVNKPHIACHLYHILYVLYLSADYMQPVISITPSTCCTCQQTTCSLSSLPHPLCVVPVNRPHVQGRYGQVKQHSMSCLSHSLVLKAA